MEFLPSAVSGDMHLWSLELPCQKSGCPEATILERPCGERERVRSVHVSTTASCLGRCLDRCVQQSQSYQLPAVCLPSAGARHVSMQASICPTPLLPSASPPGAGCQVEQGWAVCPHSKPCPHCRFRSERNVVVLLSLWEQNPREQFPGCWPQVERCWLCY